MIELQSNRFGPVGRRSVLERGDMNSPVVGLMKSTMQLRRSCSCVKDVKDRRNAALLPEPTSLKLGVAG